MLILSRSSQKPTVWGVSGCGHESKALPQGTPLGSSVTVMNTSILENKKLTQFTSFPSSPKPVSSWSPGSARLMHRPVMRGQMRAAHRLSLYIVAEDPLHGDCGCWISASSLGAILSASWAIRRSKCSGGNMGVEATQTWVGIPIWSLLAMTYFLMGNVEIKLSALGELIGI